MYVYITFVFTYSDQNMIILININICGLKKLWINLTCKSLEALTSIFFLPPSLKPQRIIVTNVQMLKLAWNDTRNNFHLSSEFFANFFVSFDKCTRKWSSTYIYYPSICKSFPLFWGPNFLAKRRSLYMWDIRFI